jgi:hypothetical protein
MAGPVRYCGSANARVNQLRTPDSSSVGNLQWVTVALAAIAVLAALDSAKTFVQSISSNQKLLKNPRVEDSAAIELQDRAEREIPREVQPISQEEKRRQERDLIKSEVQSHERQRSFIFMIAAAAMFQWSVSAFLRTPEYPLQP